MRRVARILLLLPVVALAAYVVGFRATTGEAPLSPSPNDNDDEIIICPHRWTSDFDCVRFGPRGEDWVHREAVDSIRITFFHAEFGPLQWTHPMYTGEDESQNINAVFFNEAAVWDIWFTYLRYRGIPEDSIRKVFWSLPGPCSEGQ